MKINQLVIQNLDGTTLRNSATTEHNSQARYGSVGFIHIEYPTNKNRDHF